MSRASRTRAHLLLLWATGPFFHVCTRSQNFFSMQKLYPSHSPFSPAPSHFLSLLHLPHSIQMFLHFSHLEKNLKSLSSALSLWLSLQHCCCFFICLEFSFCLFVLNYFEKLQAYTKVERHISLPSFKDCKHFVNLISCTCLP